MVKCLQFSLKLSFWYNKLINKKYCVKLQDYQNLCDKIFEGQLIVKHLYEILYAYSIALISFHHCIYNGGMI